VPQCDAMNSEQTGGWDDSGTLQVLTFDMKGETFAIEANLVREILDRIPETAVPGAPAMVGGLVNFRGRVVPLADLHMAFGFDPAGSTRDSRIIVIELDMDGEATLVGLKADKVHEVTILEKAATEAAPRVGMRWRQDFIRCLAKRAGDFVVVPDINRIFTVGCSAPTPAAATFTQH
jgi:purine-binding chemotaxis protein CheW